MSILLVTQDETIRETVRAALDHEGEECHVVVDVGSALTVLGEKHPQLALIDLALATGSALALVHHLVALDPQLTIAIIAQPAKFSAAAEALALGASTILVAPVTGDAILRAFADVRAKHGLLDRVARYQAEVRDTDDLAEAMTMAVAALGHEDDLALSEALVGLVQLGSGARGVAIYQTTSGKPAVRLAGYGTALEMRDRFDDEAALLRGAAARGAEVHYVRVTDAPDLAFVVERAMAVREHRLKAVLRFATMILPLRRVAPRGTGADSSLRPKSLSLPAFGKMLEDAIAPRGSRAALLALLPTGERGIRDEDLMPILREPGTAYVIVDKTAYVLLPELDAATARALVLPLRWPLVGVVEAPVDGDGAGALTALARVRALEGKDSPAYALAEQKSFPDLFTGLLASPASAPRATSCYPLELGLDSARSLALHATQRALAGGVSTISVSHRGPFGLDAIVRDVSEAQKDRVRRYDLRPLDAGDVELVVIEGARATWLLCGRKDKDRLKAIHTSDPFLATLVSERLRQLAEPIP